MVGPFNKLGKFVPWDGHFVLYNRDGKLLANQDGITRQGCVDLYHADPPAASADAIYTSEDGKPWVGHRIIDGSHASEN